MKLFPSFVLLILATGAACGREAPPAASSPPDALGSAEHPVDLDAMVVTAQLDRDRQQILPELGATEFVMSRQQISDLAQGGDAPFNQVILRAPGVAQDSATNGDLHIRGEHAGLQYRINGVLLPEGISGFGTELDSRFVDSLRLITGALPAQYGFRTAGIVDITTKSGTLDPGGGFSLYGGSHETLRLSAEGGGSRGRASGYLEASSGHSNLGIENPTPERTARHDRSDQAKAFAYGTIILDATSRLSVIASAAASTYQVPDTAGLPAGTAPGGGQWLPGDFDSARLDERQREQNAYAVLAYQKSTAALNLQLSGFARSSDVHFLPDQTGDLYFNGVASDVARHLGSTGLQADASLHPGADHTLRTGLLLLADTVKANSTTTVFPVDAAGDPVGGAYGIVDNHRLFGLFAGIYLEDEWKAAPRLTLNPGVRFDLFSSSFDHEHQVSPRVNLVYELSGTTTLHGGYSRYFSPPPVENVSGATLARFAGTSNAPESGQNDPVRSERSDYFDAGVVQQVRPGLQVGLDAYYKEARHALDDGLFGRSLILSAFNYEKGRVFGVELSSQYSRGPLSLYGNLARSDARGKNWSSAQFLFAPDDLAYVRNHWISLDHDQRLSGSFGAAYGFAGAAGSTRVYADAIYGTGLRTDATAADGSGIPNGGTVPSYVTMNLGVQHNLKLRRGRSIGLRLDIVNVADKIYQLRDGSGVGVNAAQYGPRRGCFGSASLTF